MCSPSSNCPCLWCIPCVAQIDVMQARNNMSSVTQAIQFGSPCESVLVIV